MIRLKDNHSFITLLIKKGYSQRGFAKKIEISSAYMSQVINGNRNPGPKVAKKICEGIEVEFDDIFFVDVDNKSYQEKTA